MAPTGKAKHGTDQNNSGTNYRYNRWFGWVEEDDFEIYPWQNGQNGDVHGSYVWKDRSWQHGNCLL